ncbi:hypothetical protein NBRC110019_27850 [Neptunitalea chrysea]|uniref:TonB-dependent receptor n=1 Tax=Neptunitalea chrysea TaxID=1647581 RepID=A0A9W6B8Y4_9FLAO|nr:TonB-dependent receptor [Neptunitalea chrysea]GLB53744.1 hypothetical protein NBRC110019_27850 [Neptunitalea chrysea]
MRKHIIYSIAITILSVTSVLAQDKDKVQEKEKDSVLGTQTVHVVQAYDPSVSDAFKIKGNPSLDDSVTNAKKIIQYTIFSVPVASTFTPAKGKASGIEKTTPEKLYNSYASLGLGNYINVLADFYTSRALSRNETLDIGFNHHSSQGGINDVELDDKFFNTKLNAVYYKRDKYMSWGANFAAQHQLYNWYGINNELFTDDQIAAIDEKQSYLDFELGGNVAFNEGYVKGGDVLIRNFSDGLSSGETNVVLKPSFVFPFRDEVITTNVSINYLSGKYDRNYLTEEELKYANVQFGINPSINLMVNEDIAIEAGATLAYMMDTENSESKFYVYPNVKASYRILDEFVTAYAGAEGKLIQNTYHDFVADNPFVSPTLLITPSSQQFDIYAGLKGKFLPTVSYDLKGSFNSTDDYAFFTSNTNMETFSDIEGYMYGNSFGVTYDKLNTIAVSGEVNVEVSNKFSIGANAAYFNYSPENLDEAYNLPSIKGTLFSDFTIGDKWFGGASVYFVGERKDLLSRYVSSTDLTVEEVTLDSYFDINFNLGYKFTDKLSAFAKLNNIANNDYQRWANYKVQGFQVVLGASYKFDF